MSDELLLLPELLDIKKVWSLRKEHLFIESGIDDDEFGVI